MWLKQREGLRKEGKGQGRSRRQGLLEPPAGLGLFLQEGGSPGGLWAEEACFTFLKAPLGFCGGEVLQG